MVSTVLQTSTHVYTDNTVSGPHELSLDHPVPLSTWQLKVSVVEAGDRGYVELGALMCDMIDSSRDFTSTMHPRKMFLFSVHNVLNSAYIMS